jgi:hypothetical protein
MGHSLLQAQYNLRTLPLKVVYNSRKRRIGISGTHQNSLGLPRSYSTLNKTYLVFFVIFFFLRVPFFFNSLCALCDTIFSSCLL